MTFYGCMNPIQSNFIQAEYVIFKLNIHFNKLFNQPISCPSTPSVSIALFIFLHSWLDSLLQFRKRKCKSTYCQEFSRLRRACHQMIRRIYKRNGMIKYRTSEDERQTAIQCEHTQSTASLGRYRKDCNIFFDSKS